MGRLGAMDAYCLVERTDRVHPAVRVDVARRHESVRMILECALRRPVRRQAGQRLRDAVLVHERDEHVEVVRAAIDVESLGLAQVADQVGVRAVHLRE